MDRSTLLDSALRYALHGWAVFPCRPGEKAPCTPHGFYDATTDPEQIRAWWAQNPRANIGLACGASHLCAVDIDVKGDKPGLSEWQGLLAQHGQDLADTVTSMTPSGGWHLLYEVNGADLREGESALAPGVDIKSRGGYIIAPPSVLSDGRGYRWAPGRGLGERPIMPLPEVLAERLAKPAPLPPRPAPRRPMNSDDLVRATRLVYQLALWRCDDYQAWLEVGMALSELGADGLALWDQWSQQSSKYEPGACERKWATIKPGEGKTIASLAFWATEDNGRPFDVAAAGPHAAPPMADGEPQRQDGHTLPRIDAGVKDLAELSEATWAAVLAANNPPRLFLHGGAPARLEYAEKGPLLRRLAADAMRYEAARCAEWYQMRKVDGYIREMPAQPPKDTITDMLAYPAEAMRLPPLDRIVGAPVYSSSGVLQARRGYHPAGRVFVHPPDSLDVPTIPTRPTDEELAAAVALIDEMIGDFPFSDQADRAAAFALALLPFVRDMIDGPTPLHLIEAPAAGTGKSLLAAILLMPAIGDDLGIMTQGRDEDEWRKRLTTRILEGRAAVLIDNIVTPLDSGTLSGALTVWPFWGDRLLGTLEPLNLPVRCAWVATANNPIVSTEIARRCVRIRLDAKCDRPFQRAPSDFKHSDLRTWARTQRGRIIAAALTLAQGWLAAGRPAPKVRPLGSYEDWTRVVGGILEHAGVHGFLTNLDDLYERADQEGAVWRRFVTTWWEKHGDNEVGVADLYPIAVEMEDFPLGRGQERAQKTALGMGLGKRRDSVLGDFRIEACKTKRRAQQWRLTRTRPPKGGSSVNLCEPCEPFRPDPEQKIARVDGGEKVHLGSQGSHLPPEDEIAAYTAYAQAARARGDEPLQVDDWRKANADG